MIRQCFVRLLDVLWREPKMIRKYYNANVNAGGDIGGNKYIFMVDGRVSHGGMFDRLKGAVSVYAMS